jgi:HSP20 family protein
MISNMLRFPLSMLDDEMERWLYPEVIRDRGRRIRASYPPINLGTTDKSVEVYLFAPGMNPDALDVVIEKTLLSIEGERHMPEAANEETSSYRQERFEGRFKRVITLPEEVDADKAEAVYKDGVLHISIPKQSELQPRQIKVSVK